MTTNRYIKLVKDGNAPPFQKRVWQRNYYEHIIRNEDDFQKIKQYISENPLKWHLDKNNPANLT
jgi:REP element-mobilizing transposase RayT